jgi:uncharacterized protein YndB with AHSA1/START domain
MATYQKVTLERKINANPQQVYRAFTNATLLREWFCDVATVSPSSDGRIYLAWDDGFYSSGHYLVLKEFKEVAFTWFGRDEPRETRVRVRIRAQKGGSLLTLEHARIGTGKAWASTGEAFQEEWEKSLDNLVSVLETGEDLRLTQRPMMGIILSDFDAEIAKQYNIPVSKGIRLDSVVGGMGAEGAGLQAGDVIVRLGGYDTPDGAGLHTALQKRRAGDRVEVEFYRGADKKTTNMQLSRRPLPKLPDTLTGVAEAMLQKAEKGFAELDSFLASISEKEACFKPGKDEWSVMEVLAHLIHGERGNQRFICDVAGYQQAHYDDYPGNLLAANAATLVAYPTLAEMVRELKQSTRETIALVSALPADFLAHKAAFWQIAYGAMEPDYHIGTHLEQMRAAVEAARG